MSRGVLHEDETKQIDKSTIVNESKWQNVASTPTNFWHVTAEEALQLQKGQVLGDKEVNLFRVSTGYFKGYHGQMGPSEAVRCDKGKFQTVMALASIFFRGGWGKEYLILVSVK